MPIHGGPPEKLLDGGSLHFLFQNDTQRIFKPNIPYAWYSAISSVLSLALQIFLSITVLILPNGV